jgi:putative membrane protein
VRVEKTVPLEQIQDLSLNSGPFLNAFGLASVKVETAGNSGPNQADMTLPGLVDARAFRNAVLDQRRRLRKGDRPAAAELGGEGMLEVLQDIRDTLKRLEARLPAE